MDHGAIEAAMHGMARSPHWPSVEREHLKIEPDCIHCGKGTKDGVSVQVHHGFPFHYCIALGRPDLELDHRNLHTLCETTHAVHDDNAHLLIGHGDDFQSSNLSVVEDATGPLHGLNAEQIKAHQIYLDRVKNRLKPLGDMTEDEKRELRAEMDAKFPVTAMA